MERSPDEELVLHDPVTCAAGVDGIARFSEESALRGLDRELSDPGALDDLLAYGHGGSTIAQDFDGDGDIDLMFGRFDGPPDLYLNDGGGSFDRVLDTGIVLPTMIPFETTSMSAVDLDDDRIPEILLGSGVQFVLYRSTGTGTFGEFEDVYFQASAPRMDFLTHNWGDPDGDGDLDLLFASASSNVGDEGDPEVLLWQDDGAFDRTTTLDNGRGTTSLLGLFTDMDGDQNQDIFIPSDNGPPSSLWRNDGGTTPEFTDVAEGVGTDIVMAAMGVDLVDLDGDGLLDYCMTDVGPPRCLQSHVSDTYFETGLGLGLVPEDWIGSNGTVGWSFDFADFDADGHLDAAQASGPFPMEGEVVDLLDWPDLLWHGSPDGTFRDATEETGFGDVDNHVGLVTADFDGDGFLDIVTAGPKETPKLHMNECSDGAWMMVELVGPEGNSEGIGAQVQIRAGQIHQTREVQSLRGLSQGPSRVHFGLGDEEALDVLTVRWPDGAVSNFADIPAYRMVTVAHPSLID